MGQSASSHSAPKPGRSRRSSFRRLTLSAMGKGNSNGSKNLSHAFSFPDDTLKVEQLNVNAATEEELMTLPGINRNLAANIVSHRRRINRFKRVEDVALVSGVGAHKLELFKQEIYVPSTSVSVNSSRASVSMDSVTNNDSVIDVNGANIFALQSIPGVNQELASRIVERRLKYGPYSSLDELAKLRGMGKHRLDTMKPYLKVNGMIKGLSVTPTPSNGSAVSSWIGPQASSTPKVNSTSRQSLRNYRDRSPSRILRSDNDENKIVESNGGISHDEIWELLSLASPRPSLDQEFLNVPMDKSSIRLGTWNLTRFDSDKAGNPGVMEVVCRTILENRLSLLALQEIESPEALETLTRELNFPSLKRVRDWRENRRSWNSIHLGAGLAVIWDSNPEKLISLREQPPATTVLLPILASMIFHINEVDVTLINIHTHDSHDNAITESFADAKNAIFVGDFTKSKDDHDCENKAPRDINTAVEGCKFFHRDKIIWGRGSKKMFDKGLTRVVRHGLNHLGIPQGWGWGGSASNHCPVWCEISTVATEV